MYIIGLTYQEPMETVDALHRDHMEWLKKYFNEGVFIASGRKVPRTGGIIFAKSIKRAELDRILAEDPFNAVADYVITEFVPTMAIESLESLTTL